MRKKREEHLPGMDGLLKAISDYCAKSIWTVQDTCENDLDRFRAIASFLTDSVKKRFPTMHEDDVGNVAELLAVRFSGIPPSFDAKWRIHPLTVASIEMLIECFGEEYPGNLAALEQMRREKKIKEWTYKRVSATEAEVAIECLNPISFVQIKFHEEEKKV